jgi:hypothetical protein
MSGTPYSDRPRTWRRLTVALACLLASVGALAASATEPSASNAPAAAAPPQSGLPQAPAPWGSLTLRPLYLEAPASLIEAIRKPDQIPIWHFPNATPGSLRVLLGEKGLTGPEIDVLLSADRLRAESGGLALLPPADLILNLAPATRQALYEVLALSPRNHFHASPLIVHGEVDDWLRESRLTPAQRGLWRRVLWQRHGSPAFSDISVLTQLASSSAEMFAARSAMTRVLTYTVTVRPGPVISTDAFLAYWTAGRRNPDAAPMLRALIERSGQDGVDLTLLLPSLAREKLYTYPSLGDGIGGRLPDCQWTSLNFFADNPQAYYIDGRNTFLELTQNYDAIPQPSQLGDLLCYVNPEGNVVHSCVYLCDDLIFTKNGESVFMPWILMRLSSLHTLYGEDGRNRLAFLRLKASAPSN